MRRIAYFSRLNNQKLTPLPATCGVFEPNNTLHIAVSAVLFAAILLLPAVFPGSVFAQQKPRLGILPFAGSTSGEGEIVATLFSNQSEIQNAFTVVPRTAAVNALMAEQNFQMSGYTDSDTIAGIGRMLNADFVVSGHIRSLGSRQIIVASIINVESFEQLAGVYREYRAIEEVPAMLPDISKRLIEATGRDTSKLPRLAVAPFTIAGEGVNATDAESLAQILAIEIANTGSYAVLPRTTTMQAALNELEYQMAGYTAEEGAKALGRAINAEYVLSAQAGNLGSMNLFTAQILNVEEGTLVAGGERSYREISDGIILMEELALLLTDASAASELRTAREQAEARRDFWGNPARLWSVGLNVGSAVPFEPLLIGTVRGTVAPIKNVFFELGFDFGMLTKEKDVKYYYIYPYAHAAYFWPLGIAGLYGGAGGGYLISKYKFPEGDYQANTFAADFIAGLILINMIDISFTFRTNFENSAHKISVGYFYRFK